MDQLPSMGWETYARCGFVWDAGRVGSLAMLLRDAVMSRHCCCVVRVSWNVEAGVN
jgi:hypothetical protein